MAAATGSLIMAGTSLAGGLAGASSAKAQAAFQQSQANQNAALLEQQAIDAEKRGDKDAQNIRKQTRNLIGEQRVATAAAGLDVNFGSTGDVQSEASAMGEQDAATAKTNAWREAFGFKSQAASLRASGEMAVMGAKNTANNTILTSGLSALAYGAKGYQDSKDAKEKARNAAKPGNA
jgi:hypothetical protein